MFSEVFVGRVFVILDVKFAERLLIGLQRPSNHNSNCRLDCPTHAEGSGKFVEIIYLFGRLSFNSLALQFRPTLRDLTCFGHRMYMLASATGSGARCAWHHDVSQTSLSNFYQHVHTWLISLASRNGAAL